jgi:hypothetical protein
MRCEAERKLVGLLVVAIAVAAWVMPSTALAQGVVLDDDEPEIKDPGDGAGSDLAEGPRTDWGVGVRLRNVFIPEGLIEFFVEDAPSGISNFGFGIEGVRRKGDLEMSFGIEYESLNGEDGLWIDKGDSIPQDEVDLVQYDDFAWVTLDATFVWHTRLHEMFALRYGAGLGLGILMGDVLRTDYVCTSDVLDMDHCAQRTSPPAENVRTPEDKVPPVFPVLNAVLGLQFRPVDKVSINAEVGMRTAFYYGLTGTFFF